MSELTNKCYYIKISCAICFVCSGGGGDGGGGGGVYSGVCGGVGQVLGMVIRQVIMAVPTPMEYIVEHV